MTTLPTNHTDGTEVITASIVNAIATQINANTAAITTGVGLTLAAGSATGAVLGSDVELVARKGAASGYASLDATTHIPIAQVPPLTTGGRVYVASGRYGTVGGSDDSTTITVAIAAAVALGNAVVDFSGQATYNCKNIPIKSGLIYDFAGATLTLPTGASSTDDVLRGNNFTSLTGTSSTTNSNPAAPWGFKLMNGTIDTGSTNTGRHALALFAIHYVLEDLTLISQGCGSALWEEWGDNNEDDGTGPNYRKGDDAAFRRGITIIDAGAPTVTAPSANDISLSVSTAVQSGGTTMTITTTRPHFLRVGMSMTTASITGAGAPNGTFTVATVTSPTVFTYTTSGLSSTYSGGTVTYHVSGAWTFLGPHDSYCESAVIFTGSTAVQSGRRGLLCGQSAGGGSSTGSTFTNTHVYLNFDVGIDCLSGNVMFGDSCQAEGSGRCIVMLRTNGGYVPPKSIFGGFGGVTMLSIRDSNGNNVRSNIFQGGSNNAAPSGFTNSSTYIETYNTSDNIIDVNATGDYDKNTAAAAGSTPTRSFMRILFDGYAISVGTLANGWLTSIDSTHCGITGAPTSLTTVTAN